MTAGHAQRVTLQLRRTDSAGAYALIRLEGTSYRAPAPGRFAMARVAGGEAPPRPVGVFTLDGGDVGILVDLGYAGDLAFCGALELLGPLGRGYDLTGLDAAGTLLVAGGIGLTVLVDVPRLLGGRPRLVAGFRTAEQAEAAVPLVDADAEVVLAPATITEPLEAVLDGGGVRAVLAAGPLGMMRAVAAACAARGVACQVALEARMACGFGACYGCAVELDGTWQRLCIEGPVVDAARLS